VGLYNVLRCTYLSVITPVDVLSCPAVQTLVRTCMTPCKLLIRTFLHPSSLFTLHHKADPTATKIEFEIFSICSFLGFQHVKYPTFSCASRLNLTCILLLSWCQVVFREILYDVSVRISPCTVYADLLYEVIHILLRVIYRKVSYYVPTRGLKHYVIKISFLTFLHEEIFARSNTMMVLTYGIS
jgi:hypothetical protein